VCATCALSLFAFGTGVSAWVGAAAGAVAPSCVSASRKILPLSRPVPDRFPGSQQYAPAPREARAALVPPPAWGRPADDDDEASSSSTVRGLPEPGSGEAGSGARRARPRSLSGDQRHPWRRTSQSMR